MRGSVSQVVVPLDNRKEQPDWHDFGPTFAAEQLAKQHRLHVGKEALVQTWPHWVTKDRCHAPCQSGNCSKDRPFDQEIVVLCIRWYLSYKLSFRDLIEMMSERGIGMAHTADRGGWMRRMSG